MKAIALLMASALCFASMGLARPEEDLAAMLEPGDTILFDWVPTSELSERMIEHLRGAQKGMLPWDLYADISALPTLLTGVVFYVLSMLGLYDRRFDMIPGKFDHNAMFVGSCSEGLRIAKENGATVAEERLRDILSNEGDVPVLVEAADPQLGIRVLSVDEYFKQDIMGGAEIAVVRVKGTDEEIIDDAIGFSLTKCGLPYDMIPFISGTRGWFDAAVDEDAYYCSELVWAAYYTASGGSIDLNTFAYSNPVGCSPVLRANPVLPDEIYYNSAVEVVSSPKVYIGLTQ